MTRLIAEIAAGRPAGAHLRLGSDRSGERWVDFRALPIGGGARDVGQLYSLAWCRDISQARRDDGEADRRDRFVHAVLASLPAQTAIVDPRGRIAEVNASWRRFWVGNGGDQRADAELGVNYFDVCARAIASGGSAAAVARQVAEGLREVLAAELDRFELDYEFGVVPGVPIAADDPLHGMLWFHVQVVPLPDGAGAVIAHTDITDRKRTEATLAYRARHDPLTGLLNRAGLAELLTGWVGESLAGDDGRLAVLFADLDGFKEINDGLGHHHGDQVLVEVTRRMSSALGDAPMARFGGDEFAVVLRHTHPDQVRAAADRLLDVMRDPFEVSGLRLTVSASVGIVIAGRHHRTADQLIRDADTAMYEVKRQGRDRCVVLDDDLHRQVVNRLRIRDRFRAALADPRPDRLTLHYQPIVSCADGHLVGVEALARWWDPELGRVSPKDFIAVAEQSGLIVSFGTWVLEQACRDCVALPSSIRVNVNVSAREVSDADFVARVRRILDRVPIAPGRLCLEITESVVMNNLDQVVGRLHEVRELGLSVALDDFGTGWSSLGRLHRLPVDQLKVDRSFVAGLAPGPDEAPGPDHSGAVVSAVIALAQGLQLPVVAEGVESVAQYERLRELGCDEAQGYLLGRPAPLAELALASEPGSRRPRSRKALTTSSG